MKSHIFISYRRDGGEALAQLLNDRLKMLGYEVFYDIEVLKNVHFNTELYRQIEACEDFLLILPPQALDRCIYDDDWVRREIRHALKHGKNIIPIMMRGFVFPKNLPDDIAEVSTIHGIEFETMKYLDARIEDITSRLHAAPGKLVHRIEHVDAPSIIRNVCSLGSCDFEHAFPADAYYSEVIDRDKYNVIYFHLTTISITDKEKIHSEFVIYDSKNNAVLNDIADYDWKPEYDTLTRSWIIRGTDGSFVKADTYRAEFRIDDSAVYEYYFKITSENDSFLKQEYVTEDEICAQNQKATKGLPNTIEKQRSRPMGLILHFASMNVAFLTLSALIFESWILGAILAAVMITLWVLLIRYTQKYVYHSLPISILLCTVFHLFYGFYLLISSAVILFQYIRRKR